MDDLSLKLDSAEETIRTRDKEIEELKSESVAKDEIHRDDQARSANLLKQKDSMIKSLDETLAASKMASESLNSKLGEAQLQLEVKEDEITHHITTGEKLKKEMGDLQLYNAEITKKLDMSLQKIKDLDELVQALTANVVGLDKESLNLLSKFDELNCLYDSYFHLVQHERDALSKHAQAQYDELHNKFMILRSEKGAIQLKNHELNDKVTELQEVLESMATQHEDEYRLAAERIQCLESEAQTLISNKEEAELSISKLEEKVEFFSESSRSLENQMQGLLLKFSALENESKENSDRLQEEILKKSKEIDSLKKEVVKLEQHADFLEKQVGEVNNVLEDKERLILWYKEQEKKLEDQITENRTSLAAIENKLLEAKKQYDLMVESKQSELSRHLKEISQRNDQAINDIKRRYELEKMEIANMEKDKADKAIAEIEGKCDQKLADCKEESSQRLMRIQEEHASLVSQIQQEHNKKQQDLIAEHSEKLKHVQLQAENEMREKTLFLRNEQEAQMKSLRCELEDECQKLQEELHIQKSKEDRQRALLQLQWKVMSDKPKEDQEVNSKQDYPAPSIKRRSSRGGQHSQQALDSPFLEVRQTPVSKLLHKVENAKAGSTMSIPQHHRKVTHHEYEVETSNGRTVTKRRKTRSTVMFEDPRKHKIKTPKANMPGSFVKGTKGGGHVPPSNIGDLFSEGSLNPYADDPYAFD
ncbi:synaptonemal complex protein 1-like isoform X2 [Prosopis cineraria]|nr:synaptonemal complex protein 1-like isoform X2 [Prosopis cineraria]